MTILFGQAPPGLQVVMTWLAPGGIPVVPERKSSDPLPQRVVVRIPINTGDKFTDSAVYRVHDFAATFTAAEDNARWTEARMLALAPPYVAQREVILTGGLVVRADGCVPVRRYAYEYYSDTIKRFVAEYRVDLSARVAAA